MKKSLIFLFLITAMTVLSACGGGSSLANSVVETNEAEPEQLVITASDWSFDQETYTIQKDQPVQFILENEQGYHGIGIKKLGIEFEQKTQPQYKITEAGEYEITCSVMCGSGHRDMKATLIVQ
ncbi:cytochrome C oxidase subunit II [Marinicrinis sediminis]|uniref:Cytochrome C oxidase subunit II n=1 Tax=Marinicrinis sediminis TaxID=1652465 RepID=A0ABW5R949_9BACL